MFAKLRHFPSTAPQCIHSICRRHTISDKPYLSTAISLNFFYLEGKFPCDDGLLGMLRQQSRRLSRQFPRNYVSANGYAYIHGFAPPPLPSGRPPPLFSRDYPHSALLSPSPSPVPARCRRMTSRDDPFSVPLGGKKMGDQSG